MLKYPNMEAERVRRGMSREDVASAVGVSAATYKNWMNGYSDIPVSKAVALANEFGCSIDYLVGLKDR